MGGFVVNLPRNGTETKQILYDMIEDRIIDASLANFAIEFVTYNPSYNFFTLSTITVQ